MIEILYSRVYLSEADAIALKGEPDIVQKLYNVIALMQLPKGIGITRKKAAEMLRLSKRQVYRKQGEYRKNGVAGLRPKSKRPKNIPNISPEWIEKMVIETRRRTGLGPEAVAIIVNKAMEELGSQKRVGSSLVHKMFVRNGLAKRPAPPPKPPKNFDWKTPNNLIQSDLTELNSVPIVTMEDDHTRKVWSRIVDDQKTETVTASMDRMLPSKFNNILTDNGRQFLTSNPVWREYLDGHVLEKHIHASVRHPQTMGKLSAYQRRLKEFLAYHMGTSRNRTVMAKLIHVYNLFVNNARKHFTTKQYPEEMYSGKRKNNWFKRVVKTFKLRDILTAPHGW